MNSESGAAILAINNAVLNITKSQFLQNSATRDGVIAITESNLIIQSSTIEQCNGGAVFGDASNV